MKSRMLVGGDEERDLCRRTDAGGDDVRLGCRFCSFVAYVARNVRNAEVAIVFHCVCGYTVVDFRAHVGMSLKIKFRRIPGHLVKPVCKTALG